MNKYYKFKIKKMNLGKNNNQLLRKKIEIIIKNIRCSLKEILKNNKNIEISKNILLDYYKIIIDNISNKALTIYLLHIISREINNSSSLLEKELLLTLLSEFYVPFINTDISLTDPYLSRILTSIQSNILSEISPLYIGEIFKKIILYIFNEDGDLNRKIICKDLFEICQGFCLYNMRQNQYNNQLSGIICLNILLNEINYYSFLNIKHYMIYIWEKIYFFLGFQNFEPKEYLLKYLFDFISKFRSSFKPYVDLAIYKILEFLDNKNYNIRKNSLNVLSLLISFYPNEIKPIKSLIVQLLTILINDKNENIRNKSKYIYNKIEKQFSLINKTIKRQDIKNNQKCLDFYDLNNSNGEYENKILETKNDINNDNNRIHNKRIVIRKSIFNNNLNIRKNSIKKNIINEKDINRQCSSKSIENRTFFKRNKNEGVDENKRYYIENILNVNTINYKNDNEIRFTELLNVIQKKSDVKCKINQNFSNLRDEVKKNNNGLKQLRKIKSEKVLITI